MKIKVSDMMNPELLKSIEGKKRELDSFRPFSAAIVSRLEEQFAVEWTYNTNAIEGNTLSLRETELVINRGITIGNKTVREHFEAINHKEGIQYLYNFVKKKKQLDEAALFTLHKIILKNINDTDGGRYRSANVMITGAVHIPPSGVKIQRLMNEFFEWYYKNKSKMTVAELAAWVHYKIVWIHPFIDGNGRAARLIMNLLLIQNGYPPAVILYLDRRKYYRLLKEADRENYNGYLDFMGRSIERSLLIYLNTLKSQNDTEDKYGYISLREAAKLCDYSMEYLSFLARTGKLQAVKIRRNWMTTREAILDYMEKINNNSKIPR